MEGYEPKRPAADTATTENLKHLARLIDEGAPLSLRINGRRVALPADSSFAVDLERDSRSGCVKVDIRWSLPAGGAGNGRQAPETRGGSSRPGHGAERASHIRLKALITSPNI